MKGIYRSKRCNLRRCTVFLQLQRHSGVFSGVLIQLNQRLGGSLIELHQPLNLLGAEATQLIQELIGLTPSNIGWCIRNAK